MAIGVDPSVPSAQSTRQTATSPAVTDLSDLTERIFSLMVWGVWRKAVTTMQHIRIYRRKVPSPASAYVPGGGARGCAAAEAAVPLRRRGRAPVGRQSER